MKKWISILLAAVMALCCVASLAEETGKVDIGTISINGAFTLKCGVPEGYKIEPIYSGPEQIITSLTHEDPAKPTMVLSVAFDETYADVDRMNDLDDEALALLEKTFTDVDPTVEISYGDTGLGTRLMIAKFTETEQDYIDFLSVYKGYFVEFIMIASEKSEDKNLSDEQLQLCIDFLTDLDFVPANMPVISSQADVAGTTVLANLSNYDAETRTLQAELKRPILLDPAMVAALQAGDTLVLGEHTETIKTIEREETGTVVVNDEIYLYPKDDGVHAFFYEQEYTETIAVLTLSVPDNLRFLDWTDPDLEAPVEHTAEEFITMLTSEESLNFASQNVNITFGADGTLEKVERFYTPWQ